MGSQFILEEKLFGGAGAKIFVAYSGLLLLPTVDENEDP